MVHGEDWPEGAVIEMYDERYRIRKNWGSYGEVEYLDGVFATSAFYWTYQGDKAQLISLPHEAVNMAV
jgi:hypothetical protein